MRLAPRRRRALVPVACRDARCVRALGSNSRLEGPRQCCDSLTRGRAAVQARRVAACARRGGGQGARGATPRADGAHRARAVHGTVARRPASAPGRPASPCPVAWLSLATGEFLTPIWLVARPSQHGSGAARYVDGAYYKGQWERGMASGSGRLRLANGDVYVGGFQAGGDLWSERCFWFGPLGGGIAVASHRAHCRGACS